MTNSGDAAEQIVRMSLEGTEVALRLTGSAAKNIAAALYTIAKNKDKNKIKGYQRLDAMLKSGKELKVFTISEEHLKCFAQEAKRYGVVYCALRGKEKSSDGMVDVMVRAEDASKINRIVERFKLSTVDAASIKHDIERSRAEKETAPAPRSRRHPKRMRTICCWMNCWVRLSRKSSRHRKTLRRQRRKKALRPSLSPGCKRKPSRVLLNPDPPSGRNCGKSKLHDRNRRKLPSSGM